MFVHTYKFVQCFNIPILLYFVVMFYYKLFLFAYKFNSYLLADAH